MKVHGEERRKPNGDKLLKGKEKFGYYGRFFEHKESRSDQPSPEALSAAMAAQMARSVPDTRDSQLPAGYTFLGQFVAHDMTFDPTSIHERNRDPAATENYRTPALDLDSLYAGGPMVTPYLYDSGYGFLLGREESPFDVPRNWLQQALMSDPRNDQNLIISQLHLVFLNLHNRVLELVETNSPTLERGEQFEKTRRIVRWLYQYVIVNDYLFRILRRDVWNYFFGGLKATPLFYHYKTESKFKEPYIPLEFSAAVFRFGHAQVKESYQINDYFQADLRTLLTIRAPTGNQQVDWSYFFDLPAASHPSQHSQLIRPRLAPLMFTLPPEVLPENGNDVTSIVARTLTRGRDWALPTGRAAAEDLKKAIPKYMSMSFNPLERNELWKDFPAGVGGDIKDKQAPLWYYILREAEFLEQGERLGFLGSWIVAEVMSGILRHKPKRKKKTTTETKARAGRKGKGTKKTTPARASKESQQEPEEEEEEEEEYSYLAVNCHWTPASETCLRDFGSGRNFTMADLLMLAQAHGAAPADSEASAAYREF